MDPKIKFPIRINRFLFLNNICSRRQADKLIERGLVFINGQRAVLGQKVLLRDKVEVADSVKKMGAAYEYILFNKPRGVVSHDPQKDEKSAENFIKTRAHISPVGRLDKDSEGLMLLTNDGRIVDKILNPKYQHEKEYKVTVDKGLKPSFKNKMERGVNIEEYITKPAKVTVHSPKSFTIILQEGKKHQIRRMCMALGYTVKKLIRMRIMNLRLGSLPNGKWRKISAKEKIDLLSALGLMKK